MNRSTVTVVGLAVVVLGGAFAAAFHSKGGFTPEDPLWYIGPRPTAPYETVLGWTHSMEPTLHGGQRIRIEAVPFNRIVVGDPINFRWEARGINPVHRVIGEVVGADGKRGLIVKGDGNLERDNFIVTEADYIGKVVPIP